MVRMMCGAGAMTGIRVSTRDISGIGIKEFGTIPRVLPNDLTEGLRMAGLTTPPTAGARSLCVQLARLSPFLTPPCPVQV